ncbi:DUF1304 domain-containing protein [Streptomyces gobiensis]|uniref:DUF1304 domain-containing protein n=1 Tax=Streptomyces gobiensis TaxID=2875706 RepID=UPI001E64F433|nr:DUF1304 domain-containing protein [Streptomyces gobiensis]UGY91479.1 DUF1304 domain-containing protein [Streptomyces gobiensis]
MNAVTQVFALIAGLTHIALGTLESFFYHRPEVRTLLTLSTDDAPEAHLWTFNVGFYNILLGAGPIVGFIALHAGNEAAARALVFYSCAFMVAAGLVLLVSDARLWRGTVAQSVPPAIALVALAF